MRKILFILSITFCYSCSTITNYTDSAISYDKLIQGKDFMYIFMPNNYNTSDVSYYKSGNKKYDDIFKDVALLDKYGLDLSKDKNVPFNKNEIKLEISDLESRIKKLDIIKDFSGSKTKSAATVSSEIEKSKQKLSNLKQLLK